MTTTDNHEVITEALAILEELRLADADAHELTRPFRQFAATIGRLALGVQLGDVEFAATIDAEVRRRLENFLDEMDIAASLVETAARSTLLPNALLASAGVRSWFAEAMLLPELRASLVSVDVLLGTEPTAQERADRVDAEIAEF
jgi:hypothetical protein